MSSRSSSSSSSSSSSYKNIFTNFVPPVGAGLELFDYGRKGARKGKSFRGRYAIDLASNVLNLKTNKVSDLYKGGAGAFGFRRIISKDYIKTKRRMSKFGSKAIRKR
jgi:hypothetical protein